jgi:hypothetical protein
LLKAKSYRRFRKKTAPILVNFNFVEIGAVPIPIHRSKVEIRAALTTFQKEKTKGRAVLVNHLRSKIYDEDRTPEIWYTHASFRQVCSSGRPDFH